MKIDSVDHAHDITGNFIAEVEDDIRDEIETFVEDLLEHGRAAAEDQLMWNIKDHIEDRLSTLLTQYIGTDEEG